MEAQAEVKVQILISVNQSINQSINLSPIHRYPRWFDDEAINDLPLVEEDLVPGPAGSCCDNGRFVFPQTDSGGWWYNNDEFLGRVKTWLKFGASGFSMPAATEHQAVCEHSAFKRKCPLPSDCEQNSGGVICKEIPIVRKVKAKQERRATEH